jgi:hypothetical protein
VAKNLKNYAQILCELLCEFYAFLNLQYEENEQVVLVKTGCGVKEREGWAKGSNLAQTIGI